MSSAEPTSAAPQPLPQIGSYRLVEPLGSGGMSSVFRAVHVDTGHEVAVKILPRTMAKNSTLLQRFLREAKSAESLEHPNVVAIYDRGTEDGRYYLVLEYVPGGDLHDRVRNRGALPVDEAVRIILGVARGLDYAGRRGLIHRDIKPANILLTPEGEAKVADLGLAVQLDEEDERVTRDGTTVGTVDYMAPEQARDSRATSIRSDIYSLGCTFYHILTGLPPFAGGDVTEKLRRHAFEVPKDLRSLRPEVPADLAAIVERMLAKKPEKRFPGYPELIAALDAVSSPGAAALDAIVVDDDEDGPPEILDAIVEDDEPGGDFLDSREVGLGSTMEARTIPEPSGPGRPGSSAVRPPSGAVRPGSSTVGDPGSSNTRPGSRNGLPAVRRPATPPSRPEISLAELAKLDDDETVPSRKLRNRASAPSTAPGVPPSTASGAASPMAAMLDEADEYALIGAPPAGRRYIEAGDDDLRTWIVRGLLLGVAIVLVGFGLHQLYLLQFSESDDPVPTETAAPEGPEAPGDATSGAGPGADPVRFAITARGPGG